MNLSRAAKKFRDQLPQESEAPKRAKAKKKAAATPPAAAPVPEVRAPEPVPEPAPVPVPEPDPVSVPAVAGGESTAQPKKGWPVKMKRPRFVREKVEKQEQPVVPPLTLGSTKPAARLLTKNLAIPPKDEARKPGSF